MLRSKLVKLRITGNKEEQLILQHCCKRVKAVLHILQHDSNLSCNKLSCGRLRKAVQKVEGSSTFCNLQQHDLLRQV